jgi:toxin ParE1/3/4
VRPGKLSTAARTDVREAAVYIGADSPRAAARFISAVRETLDLIAEQPAMGVSVFFPPHQQLEVRRFRVNGFERYLIFYTVTKTRVLALRVVHGARDLDNLFS